MLMDSKWAFRNTAGDPSASDNREAFAITTATDYLSGPTDLHANGYNDGGGDLFLHVSRTGTYTKNLLTNLRVSIMHADAASGVAYNSTLTSGVEAVGVDVPVAAIDASSEIVKIALPPNLKRYIGLKLTSTGAATALTVNARITTS